MGKTAKKCLALLGMGLLLGVPRPALPQSLEEQKVMAALTLNIVRFTTWPEEAAKPPKHSLDICVVGDNVVQQSFADIDQKAIGNKTLRVVALTRLRNFEDCQALYVSDLKQNILLQLFDETKTQALLTIGEGYDFAAQGGMVGLENVDGKIALYINLPAMREANLQISARLLKLAHIIGK